MKRVARLAGLLAVAALLACSACRAETVSQVKGDVGVAPFAQAAGEGAPLPDVAAQLAAKLETLDVGKIIPPAAIGPEASTLPTPVERAALQTRTGARTLVLGTATRVGQALSLDARLIDLGSGGEIGLPLVEQASADADVPRAIDALAARIATRLKEPPPASMAEAGKPAGKKHGPREPIEIQGDQLDAETVTGGRRLAFVGNVTATQGEVHVRCDRLEAFYPTGASQPDRVTGRGNVHVEQRDRTATCDEAIFYRLEDRIVCVGKPAELTEKCNRAQADQITFHTDTERLEMVHGKVLARECEEAPKP